MFIHSYPVYSQELKSKGIAEDKLQLLVNVTGAFRPGVLTALVGVSGAGKTTLMDVLAGRKTGGLIEGDITISGYPKNQETFMRISGYCEQTDVHSPCMTIIESLLYSAFLRLPSNVDNPTRKVWFSNFEERICTFAKRIFIYLLEIPNNLTNIFIRGGGQLSKLTLYGFFKFSMALAKKVVIYLQHHREWFVLFANIRNVRYHLSFASRVKCWVSLTMFPLKFSYF